MSREYIFLDFFKKWLQPFLQPAIDRSLVLFPDRELVVATFGWGHEIYGYGPLVTVIYIAAVLAYFIWCRDVRRVVMLFSFPGFAIIVLCPILGGMWILGAVFTFSIQPLENILAPTVYVFCLLPFFVFLALFTFRKIEWVRRSPIVLLFLIPVSAAGYILTYAYIEFHIAWYDSFYRGG